MAWFNGVDINEVITLEEGKSKSWNFSLDQTCPVSLNVERRDGAGIDIFVIPADEYYNFTSGKIPRVYTDLSFNNIDSFRNTVSLGAGEYYLIARLQRINEGEESYAVAAIRCENLT